jgi:hypothetical protein
MFRKSTTYTQAEADAFKTISDGKAAQVTAWMPIMIEATKIVKWLVMAIVTVWLAG